MHYIKAIREGTLIKEHISVVCAWNFASLKGSKKKGKNKYLGLEIIKKVENGEEEEKISDSDIQRLQLVLLVLDSIKISGSLLTIQNCFRKSGLYPFNVQEPLDNDRIIISNRSFYEVDVT